ncbi:Spo0B domain-containing protein [Virgibacillus oceani]|uniref:SpoOB alpha-helical domain-containing protein n=1 Tax=Virgibacillus oceani TaxID=1479511 RepID=A0A917LW53_9BACI|nr:Spo0B domain-containing protein [Virgibacillus oceani]GGG62549.1 hypothetical protein GCM10011398_02370 [Virgibacillus oceani]
MREKDIIDVLRLYRHDLMNDLQIIQGYLTMGKMDKVHDKITSCMAHFDKERKLMSLNIPKFALWLIQFNSLHATFRFTYDICIENKNLNEIDTILLKQCQACINFLEKAANDSEVFEGNISLGYQDEMIVTVQIFLAGNLKRLENYEAAPILERFSLHMKQEDDGITCNLAIPLN